MDIYSIDIDGNDLRRETEIYAYSIGGKLTFDRLGENLYFYIIYTDSTNQVDERKSGPYVYNLDKKELKSLVPTNAANLHNKINNHFLTNFLTPVSANFSPEIFLLSATTIYKMNMETMEADFFYEQSEDDRIKKVYRVQSFIPFHRYQKYLMVKQTGKNESSFFILNEKGEVEKMITPNMEGLIE